jgi:gamma-glutamyl-gamma-aminobutyraldehyde dehydrogenase
MPTREQWRERAANLEFRSLPYIGGEPVEPAGADTIQVIDPGTGQHVTEVAAGGEADVNRAVASAREAFRAGSWSRADPAERKQTLLRLAELVRRSAEELALLDSLNMGKLITDSYTGDIPHAADVFQWYAETTDKTYGEIAPSGDGDLALVTREPLGVVAAVIPWNFPFSLASWKVAPALAAGNSVVLKPAEQSPLSALRLAELAAEAGVPAGVLNVVPGYGETAGQALGRHPDVDCLAFTGSSEVGKLFLRYSSESNMKPVWLECGGKSPNVVFADSEDLDEAAERACFAVFWNQGQVCSSNSRLLVERSIHDDFVSRLLDRVRGIRLGDQLDPGTKMGPLVDETQLERVLGYIERGRGEATLAVGGERVAIDGGGCFVEPTVFTEVANSSVIAQDEIFGPVLAVIPFEDEAQAIEIANDTRYGLAASLWTSNVSRALRVSSRLRAGTVSVNSVHANGAPIPFGGFKESGFGRDLSLHSLEKYSAPKTTWIHYG